MPGDWYLAAGDASPMAGAFLGQPVDSFPPAIQLTPIQTEPGDWVALTAQLGRRGAQRPAVFGRRKGRVRRVTVAVDGLWRWAFRGGSSEQSYRTWVAATASWLLGGADSAAAWRDRCARWCSNGRPVVFEWTAPGPPRPGHRLERGRRAASRHLAVRRQRPAAVWLRPGSTAIALPAAAAARWPSRNIRRAAAAAGDAARAHAAVAGVGAARRAGLAVAVRAVRAGLAGEWIARRRLGLR